MQRNPSLTSGCRPEIASKSSLATERDYTAFESMTNGVFALDGVMETLTKSR
jgi:hypothetical protein